MQSFLHSLSDVLKFASDHELWAALVVLFLWLSNVRGAKRIMDYVRSLHAKETEDLAHSIKKIFKKDAIIDKLLRSIVIEYDADRVMLMQYHNGGGNLMNEKFTKFTITHEQVQVGTEPIARDFQGVHAGLLAYIHEQIIERNEFFVENLGELCEVDLSTHHVLCGANVASAYFVGLFNVEDMPIGMVCVHFTHRSIRRDQVDLEGIRASCLKICGRMIQAPPAEDDGATC